MADDCRKKDRLSAARIMDSMAKSDPLKPWDCAKFDAVQDMYRTWLNFDVIHVETVHLIAENYLKS